MTTSKYDKQIVVLRFLAIIFIVFHHCTSIYLYWPSSDLTSMGLPHVFERLTSISKIYGLGIFTFISGFLMALSGKTKIDKKFLWNKTKRILIPCAIAAIFYFLLFPDFAENSDPINGTHLWYLPMIFLFYLTAPFINTKNPVRFISGLLLLITLSVLLYKLTEIRTFKESMIYMGFFVSGALFYRFIGKIPNYCCPLKLFGSCETVLNRQFYAVIGLSSQK